MSKNLTALSALIASRAAGAITPQELDTFVQTHGVNLVARAQLLVRPPFSFDQVGKFYEAVAEAVRDGFKVLEGEEAGDVAAAIADFLLLEFVVPKVPALRQLVDFGVTARLVRAAYDYAVKPKAKKAAPVTNKQQARSATGAGRVKRLALVLLVLLAACAPRVAQTPPVDAGSLTDPAVFELLQEPQRLRLAAGPSEILVDRLDVEGEDLAVNDARCVAVFQLLRCEFSGVRVPESWRFMIDVLGKNVRARITYRRGGETFMKTVHSSR